MEIQKLFKELEVVAWMLAVVAVFFTLCAFAMLLGAPVEWAISATISSLGMYLGITAVMAISRFARSHMVIVYARLAPYIGIRRSSRRWVRIMIIPVGVFWTAFFRVRDMLGLGVLYTDGIRLYAATHEDSFGTGMAIAIGLCLAIVLTGCVLLLPGEQERV